MTPSPEHIELAGARARIRELEKALQRVAYSRTLHGGNGKYYWECHFCRADNESEPTHTERANKMTVHHRSGCPLAALSTVANTETLDDKESTDN